MNKFCREALILLALMVVVTLMPGCSTIQIPANTQVLEFNSPSEYPEPFQHVNAFTLLMDDGALIYTIKGNRCLMEHEVWHVVNGAGHDDMPDYLKGCRV